MSKPVEIGSTLAVVLVFIALLAVSEITGYKKPGAVAAILVFILLSTGAGYLNAQKTYA